MSRILLAGVLDGQYLYDVCAYAVDEHIVRGDDRLARVGDAPGAVHIGMVGQSLGGIFEKIGEASGSSGIAIGDIFDDPAHIVSRFRAPDDVRHYAWRAFLASMMARNSAIT